MYSLTRTFPYNIISRPLINHFAPKSHKPITVQALRQQYYYIEVIIIYYNVSILFLFFSFGPVRLGYETRHRR